MLRELRRVTDEAVRNSSTRIAFKAPRASDRHGRVAKNECASKVPQPTVRWSLLRILVPRQL